MLSPGVHFDGFAIVMVFEALPLRIALRKDVSASSLSLCRPPTSALHHSRREKKNTNATGPGIMENALPVPNRHDKSFVYFVTYVSRPACRQIGPPQQVND